MAVLLALLPVAARLHTLFVLERRRLRRYHGGVSSGTADAAAGTPFNHVLALSTDILIVFVIPLHLVLSQSLESSFVIHAHRPLGKLFLMELT